MKTLYRMHEIVIETDPKTNQIVYDVFRNRQYVLAGFSYTDVSAASVLTRLKEKINESLSQV